MENNLENDKKDHFETVPSQKKEANKDIFNEDDLMDDFLEEEYLRQIDPDRYFIESESKKQDDIMVHDPEILEEKTINLDSSTEYIIGSDDSFDNSEAVTFIINYDDGTKKEIVLDSNSKLIQESLEIEQNNSLDEIKKTLIKDLNKIDSIEVKNGDKYHKKIKIKDFLNKELNTINHSSNPEKLGEDIIIAILKPLKIYNNYLGQIRQEKENKLDKNLDKQKFTIEVDKQEYVFKNYSEDFKKIIAEDKSGKQVEIENNKNFKFIVSPGKDLNNVELDLLIKGKELIHKEKLPFKINRDTSGSVQYSTITETEFLTNLNPKEKVSLSKKTEKSTSNGISY